MRSKALAEVSEGNQCGQKHSQRQRKRDERQSCVEEELGQHTYFKSLAHQLVYEFPQELHHEYEETNEKGTRKKQAEALQNEYI